MDLSSKIPVKRARIEIVPLIDCMFLLLVFFVYTMMTLTQPQGIPLNLLAVRTASPIHEESLTISITDEDNVYLNNQKVSFEALAAGISAARSANPSLRVLINGDRDASHGAVVKALDILRTQSVEHVAIQTTPTEREER
ncbi:MAG: biopolymer transporter ExbD [Candidatus Lindowbacteria bacterium]|nr:biopolymer transporter ExbD [Candidatus Lindowbacteria bacterium]